MIKNSRLLGSRFWPFGLGSFTFRYLPGSLKTEGSAGNTGFEKKLGDVKGIRWKARVK